MNVRIKFSSDFVSGCHWRDKFYMNRYFVTIHMVTQTTDITEQNIAFDRLKYMLSESFFSKVFINSTETKQIKLYNAAGIELAPLPEDPLDQIIGIMLFTKLNSVMEEKIMITDLELKSELGDNVIYQHSAGENIGPFAKSGWWHDPSPVCSDSKSNSRKTKEERVVKLHHYNTWHGVNLDWNEEEPQETPSTVVYANFNKDETE